jgi:hypothetical protein
VHSRQTLWIRKVWRECFYCLSVRRQQGSRAPTRRFSVVEGLASYLLPFREPGSAGAQLQLFSAPLRGMIGCHRAVPRRKFDILFSAWDSPDGFLLWIRRRSPFYDMERRSLHLIEMNLLYDRRRSRFRNGKEIASYIFKRQNSQLSCCPLEDLLITFCQVYCILRWYLIPYTSYFCHFLTYYNSDRGHVLEPSISAKTQTRRRSFHFFVYKLFINHVC